MVTSFFKWWQWTQCNVRKLFACQSVIPKSDVCGSVTFFEFMPDAGHDNHK